MLRRDSTPCLDVSPTRWVPSSPAGNWVPTQSTPIPVSNTSQKNPHLKSICERPSSACHCTPKTLKAPLTSILQIPPNRPGHSCLCHLAPPPQNADNQSGPIRTQILWHSLKKFSGFPVLFVLKYWTPTRWTSLPNDNVLFLLSPTCWPIHGPP